MVRFQGPKANGMPELHKLMPPLGVLQDRGFKVALVTDGRLSGASGKVPPRSMSRRKRPMAAPIAQIRDGDIIRVDAHAGTLTLLVRAAEWARAPHASRGSDPRAYRHGPRIVRRLPQRRRRGRTRRQHFRWGAA